MTEKRKAHEKFYKSPKIFTNVIAIPSANTNVLIKPMSAVDQRVQQDEVRSKIDSSYLVLKLNLKCLALSLCVVSILGRKSPLTSQLQKQNFLKKSVY